MQLLKLPLQKEMSLGVWTLKRPSAPEKLFVPVWQDAPFYQQPCVMPGQPVAAASKIAEPRSSAGIPVFSPVNGTVGKIESARTAAGEAVLTIEIQTDKKNLFIPAYTNESQDWMQLTAEKLKQQLRAMGVMLCGPHARPLTAFLEEDPFRSRTLIINACESEPYVTSGQVLLLSKPLEILKGAEILRRAAGLEKIVFAVSSDAGQAAELLKSKIYFLKWEHASVRILPAGYPQDDPALLLPVLDAAFTKYDPSRLHAWPLPDIATIYAAYEAVVLNKPFFERVVTVTGECIVQPQNFLLPFGMTMGDAAKAAKGFLRAPGRFLAGGPMRGRAVLSWEEPLSPAVDAVLGLAKENTAGKDPVECIRCGECAEICPVNISPVLISMAAWNGDWQGARELDSAQCIACGGCSYICPSHLPLAQTVREAF